MWRCAQASQSERSKHILAQLSGQAPELWFEFLVALLINKEAEAVLLQLNPFLSQQVASTVVRVPAARPTALRAFAERPPTHACMRSSNAAGGSNAFSWLLAIGKAPSVGPTLRGLPSAIGAAASLPFIASVRGMSYLGRRRRSANIISASAVRVARRCVWRSCRGVDEKTRKEKF